MLARQWSRNCGDAVQQLFVEQEILAKRLACRQAVASDNLAQRR
jgi:hypothetical protein